MKVHSIALRNFKRFTDLSITDIPSSARLVVVVGPNGSGKSSLFDAFNHWYRLKAGFGHVNDLLYFRKGDTADFNWGNTVTITLHDNATMTRGGLYIRTAYRNDPDFSVKQFTRPHVPSERVTVERTIQNDQTVSDNYQRLIYNTMSGVYDPRNNAKSVEVLRNELIGEVRASMKRVFGDLLLNSITDPLGEGAFHFEKGSVAAYHYKNLSGGEKAAFDLILDLHLKRQYYPEAIYCIDEVETHLHTKVQGSLLKELFNIVPPTCQLWITTHSLGALRAAQELAQHDPGAVSFIDFGGTAADESTHILPTSLGKAVWEKALAVTLDDLSDQIAPRELVLCEGSSIGTRRKGFDADIYNRVFGTYRGGLLFISAGSSNDVLKANVSVRDLLKQMIPTTKIFALRDRDDLSEAEVAAWEAGGGVVLALRNIESYLLADDVIEALVNHVNLPQHLTAAKQVKLNALAASRARGNPQDDLKSAAGDIFVGLKQLLSLTRCGNNSDAFMRDTLAPLIVPGMATFAALKADVLDRCV